MDVPRRNFPKAKCCCGFGVVNNFNHIFQKGTVLVILKYQNHLKIFWTAPSGFGNSKMTNMAHIVAQIYLCFPLSNSQKIKQKKMMSNI